ncbi:hypothetical protein M495_19070 [Serratia liquefaciens ATCC 27592]|nr:hypothetical protein M495_19070 [Serratia liquefaciens ATCC 27592]
MSWKGFQINFLIFNDKLIYQFLTWTKKNQLKAGIFDVEDGGRGTL